MALVTWDIRSSARLREIVADEGVRVEHRITVIIGNIY